MIARSVLLLLSLGLLGMAGPSVPANPFAVLREAYAKRDSAMAASAYSAEAEVAYIYDGVPEERLRGRAAIEKSFAALFADLPGDAPLDLNFRTIRRDGTLAEGIYRLRVGPETSAYGSFAARIGSDGLFTSDVSRSATQATFEEAAGPVMLAPDDEELDRGYYGGLTGRYRLADGCVVVVTRSVRRLFARNVCNHDWRGLNRIGGRDWTAGLRTIDPKAALQYSFAPLANGQSPAIKLIGKTGLALTAQRDDRYVTHDVRFNSADGTRLAGTLYKPSGSGRRPAIVLIHGSGPQDRDGYASIIAVLADALAAEGRVVLTYDKRGSGQSRGNGDRAGFEVLAQDAIAGMQLLATRADVDPARIGIGGSSQAGWVAAQVVKSGAIPADVLLLGAAGAALTVREQNLFNTDVLMRCAGIARANRKLALDQQGAFFDFLADSRHAARLDRLTRKASQSPVLTDWLFPDSKSIDRSGSAWYSVLDPRFDPLPVWRGYRGKAMFLFAEMDDSTPTVVAVKRLSGAGLAVRVLPRAQHLGMEAESECKGGLEQVTRFSPALFEAITLFAR